MSLDPSDIEATGAAIAAVLRALRERRHLRQAEVARSIGVSLRTYQDLEAGSGRLQLDQLAAFAAVTDSDQLAVLGSVMRRSTRLAVASADIKILTLIMRLLDDFQEAAGGDIAKLRPNDIVSALRPVFAALARELAARTGDAPDPPTPASP